METLRRLSALLLVVLAVGFLPACSRNPLALKRKYFDSGNRYFEQGKYREAAIQFSNAVRVDPNYAEAQFGLGVTDQRLGRWQESYRALTKAIELQPSFILARLELVELLISANRTNEARAQVEAAQALDPKNVRAQSLLARTYLADHNFLRAIEEFQKAQQLAPDDALLWISTGFAKVGAKQYASAENDFRKAIGLDPKSTEAYVNLADLYRLTGRAPEVEPLLRQALETLPPSLELYLNLADFYFQQGRIKDAEELFDKMKSHAADFPGLGVQLGDFWTWHNDPGHAAEEYKAALVERANPVVQKKLINADVTLGRLDEGERLNQQLLAENPKDLEGHAFRAALAQLRGDSPAAIEELRRVLKEEPSSLFANYYLGLALKTQGKQDEAEAAFMDCLRLDGNFGYAFQQLSEIQLQRKNLKQAMEYAEKAIALMPRAPDGYLLLARVHLVKGDGRKAEQVLGQAAQVAPKSPELQELLAQAYIAQGKIEAGLRAYEQLWTDAQDPVVTVDRFAHALSESGQLNIAIQQVAKLTTNRPRPGYYEILARLYLRKGDLAAAETSCHEALKFDGSHWLAHFYLGEIYDRRHGPERAVAEYDEIIKSQPQMIPPYILAGDILLREGKLNQAASYYEAAQQREPDSALVQHSLARLWAEESTRLLDASALVQGLQEKFPDDPHLSDTLAWIYYQKGMYSPALSLLKHCVDQQPESALFHFHLGMTYLKLGQTSLGRRTLETALRLGLNSDRWEAQAREAVGSVRGEAR
jgi:pentatricopeptide repeat protein